MLFEVGEAIFYLHTENKDKSTVKVGTYAGISRVCPPGECLVQ